MQTVFEILLSVFAVFGVYSLLSDLKRHLLFKKRVRNAVRLAVFTEALDDSLLAEASSYAKFLGREREIGSGRLIIFRKNAIMKSEQKLAVMKAASLRCDFLTVNDEREEETVT